MGMPFALVGALCPTLLYYLVTVGTYGDFIVLPHWEIILTQYPTQSHYTDTELTSLCPIQSARQRSDKHQFYKSFV